MFFLPNTPRTQSGADIQRLPLYVSVYTHRDIITLLLFFPTEIPLQNHRKLFIQSRQNTRNTRQGKNLETEEAGLPYNVERYSSRNPHPHPFA